jgi:hypothetical protein
MNTHLVGIPLVHKAVLRVEIVMWRSAEDKSIIQLALLLEMI